MTGKYLGYKPGVLEQGKYQHYPLGVVLSKRLNKDDKGNKVVKYDYDSMYQVGQKKRTKISNLYISQTVISINAILSISYL